MFNHFSSRDHIPTWWGVRQAVQQSHESLSNFPIDYQLGRNNFRSTWYWFIDISQHPIVEERYKTDISKIPGHDYEDRTAEWAKNFKWM